MHPEICKIGPFTVYSYGLMLAVAFIVSASLAKAEAKKRGVNPEIIFNFLFIVFVWGIIGARIFYILENFSYFALAPLEVFMIWQGGLSWFGGLILGLIAGIIYIKSKKLSVSKVFDLVIPFVVLAHAIGRIGCFLNGCCYGRASNFGVYFPVHKQALVPTQIYSSLILFLIFIVLKIRQARPHRDGEIFFSYLMFYSLKRFFIEFWRADNQIVFWGLTLFQLISIVTLIVAVAALVIIKQRQIQKI